MTHPSRFKIVGVAACAVVLSACSDGVTTPRPEDAEPASALSADAGAPVSAPRNPDELFAQLGRSIPGGFGGMYFDTSSTDLVVYLQRPAEGREAIASLRQAFPDPRISTVGIVVQEGRYEWRQLQQWRQHVDRLLALSGVRLTSIDERLNRLRVGVANSDVAARVRVELERAGVPQEAVVIDEVPLARPALTLRDEAPAVDGGYQIDNGNRVGALCTVGFNIAYGGYYGFMTAAHCTRTVGVIDSDPFYQATVGAGFHVGTETVDPPVFGYGEVRGDWACPPGGRCRLSDVAIARHATNRFNFPYLAQTTFRGVFPTDTGSITVDPNYPRQKIVAQTQSPMVGETLEKIGRTTGWTSGTVSETCAHVRTEYSDGSWLLLMCQGIVDARAEGGDSGSPVFKSVLGGANLYGVVWGSYWPTKAQFLFSDLYNIQDEFGTVAVR